MSSQQPAAPPPHPSDGSSPPSPRSGGGGGGGGAGGYSSLSSCEAVSLAVVTVLVALLSAVLLWFGVHFSGALCSEPLALWGIVAGSLLLGAAALALLDVGLPSLRGLGAQARDGSRRGGSWFSVLTVAQVAVLAALLATFVFGAYAVLAIFGLQRNASPGTEVCDRALYDPLFFIIILVDLVLVIALLLAICLNCDALCCCGSERSAADRAHKKTDGDGEADALLAAEKEGAGAAAAAAAQPPVVVVDAAPTAAAEAGASAASPMVAFPPTEAARGGR